MLLRALALSFLIAGVTGMAAAAENPAADAVLVSGSPLLTSAMVDQRIAVWESFLQVRFTDAQKSELRDILVADWRRHDKDAIHNTLEDLKLYGHQEQLDRLRLMNQDNFIENLRAKKYPEDAILLQAFEAAHPDRRDVMHPHGYGDLVGTWSRGDASPFHRDPYTGRLEGISFTESSTIRIFSDGRFQHAWLHRHCENGDRCCREYSTAMGGGLSIQGQTFVLSGEFGQLGYKDACAPARNISKTLGPRRETVEWSLKRNPANRALVLCLAQEPFQLPGQTQHNAVCYTKHPQ